MMPTALKLYSEYRPSGLGWLGDVPTHWAVQRCKTFMRTVDIRSKTGSEELLTVSAEHGVIPRETANVTMFQAASYEGYKLCWPGDLVINSLWAWARGLGVTSHHGIISSAYGVYRLLPSCHGNTQYIHYMVRSLPFQWELQVRSKGIWTSRLQLTDESFLNAPIPFPPPDEQTAIVRYLDHADGRIQHYIRTKERLIDLLTEQKQAIINQAVTRGLDPNVPLKPSSVEWLNRVPAHWEVRRLKTICDMKSGDGIDSAFIAPAGEYPVYGGNGIRGCTSSYTHDGEFALIGRQGALCGNVHLVCGKFWASEHAVVASLDTSHNLIWFGAILEAMNLNQYSISAAQPGLSVERVLNLSLPVPPLDEQAIIAQSLDNETTEIAAAVSRAHRQIELMQEYRTRLIADVVTGKLDVREADEVDMPTP